MVKDDYIWFIPGVTAPEYRESNDLWFVLYNGRLIVKEYCDEIQIPIWDDIIDNLDLLEQVHYLGELRGVHCYASEIKKIDSFNSKLKCEDLRNIMARISDEIFLLCSRAINIINWDKDHKFCGRCGGIMEVKTEERAKYCSHCGVVNYPRISPAIIVAVTKENKILMAHNMNFKNDMHSVIAGFVDAGETFEDCVKREVMEEVGIRVKNVKYFISQPWPFPNSLMIAFTAEYDGGEITVDGVEIDHADWYSADKLPSIPGKGSVARKLIDWFLKNNKL